MHQHCRAPLGRAVFVTACIAASLLAAGGVPQSFASTPREPAGPVFTFSGTVSDYATREPMPGVTVYVPSLTRGAASDSTGRYSIDEIPAGSYIIVFRQIGYRDSSVAVSVKKNTTLNIRLVPSDVALPEVVIRANRDDASLEHANRSVAVLSDAALEQTRGQTLGATLEQIPGVTTLQTGPSISKPIIRGLHSQRVLVLNAGVPMEGQQWGGEHAPEIDPFAPSKIEVLKGAAGVEYGAGAIGGVVNLSPRALRDVPGIAGQLSLNGFSNNRQGSGSITLEGNHPFLPGFSWRTLGSYRRAGNEQAARYIVGNTGFSELDGSATLGYAGDNGSLEAYYSHFETELGIYKGSHIGSVADLMRALNAGGPLTTYDFTYDIKPPKQDISHDLWSVKGLHRFSALGELEAQFGRQSNHRQEYDAYRFFNDVQTLPTRAAFDLALTTYTAELKFKHNPAGGFTGSAGVSGMRQGNVTSGSSFLIPNYRLYSGGVYAIEYWTRGDLTLSGGARYDYRWIRVYPFPTRGISETVLTYGSISGALGAVYDFSGGWSIGGNLGTAFRPPGINELFSDGVHHGSAQYERGDPNLHNERSWSADFTVRRTSGPVTGEFSVYNNYMENFIFLFPSPVPTLTLRGTFPTFLYKQANSVLRGMDGSIRWQAADHYTVNSTLSIVRGTNLESGEPLFQMPADRLRLAAEYRTDLFAGMFNPMIGIQSTLVRKQDRVPPNADYLPPPPGYVLFGFTAACDFNIAGQLVHASIDVTNLFNAAYRDYLSRFRYYIDDPGRDIALRLRIPFGDYESHSH